MNPQIKDSDITICSNCVMDNSCDKKIFFDSKGKCNYCTAYVEREKTDLFLTEEQKKDLKATIEKVKLDGKNKDYDCIIGLSGGVDSAMVAYIVKEELGLRPLAVHLDNGWNLELSVSNIENIVKKLEIDLHTVVLDWEMFKNLHLSFLKSSTINSEIPTDHAINALLFRIANKEDVKYIFTGSNLSTEGIMPSEWCGYDNKDYKFIKGISKRFGINQLKGYPHLSLFYWFYYIMVKKIKFIPILNYRNYNKKESLKLLKKEIDFKPYGPKHSESIYTRFFQSYILPEKFKIDKRKPHLSSLINSGQCTRKEALEELAEDYYDKDQLEEDKNYIIKKLDISTEDFEEIMSSPIQDFSDYPNNNFWFELFEPVVQYARRLTTLR